ncbi:MAG TPA: zincin-like metallopeptidase domain-containing protein [Hanamia sp.]
MDSQNTSSTKLDVYEMVTTRVIELLEAGTVPWQKPWTDAGVPMNLISKRPYRGINLWLLLSLNYERNLFLTWDQLKKIGGSVNQGEHGHIVIFWKNVKKQPEELGKDGHPKTVPMLRYYKVFNIAQCRDLSKDMIEPLVTQEHDTLLECEGIIHSMPDCPVIKHMEQRAFYHIGEDYINMPKKKSFKSIEAYYSTLFHELVHSTGAEKRLGRKSITEMNEFGSEPYSIEELIAELGAAYLCSFTGILDKGIQNSAAYINGWLNKLRNDKRFIVQASGQAQRGVDCILNLPLVKDERLEVAEEVGS